MVEENCGAPLSSVGRSVSRSVSFRDGGDRSAGRIDRSVADVQRADEGIISHRRGSGRARGAKIDHVAMVKSIRNGERPGPAPLIPPADQKGKKRNVQVPTHATRYLTGQSISLSRAIIPGGGVENHIRGGPDNYTRVRGT